MIIDQVTVCSPIEETVNLLLQNGFVIVESKLADYHFHEVYIKMKGVNSDCIQDIKIKDIKMFDDNKFRCNCHWSIIELI